MTTNEIIKFLEGISSKEKDEDIALITLGALIKDYKLGYRKCSDGPLVVIYPKETEKYG